MLRSLCAVLILQASAAADRPSHFAVRPTVDGAQHRSLLSLLGGAVAGDAAMLSEAPSASAAPAAPPFSLSFIEARYRALSDGLDPMVDVSLLAHQVTDGLYEGVSELEVDELMAETAAYQASMHPDFARLAARVAASRLHAQTEPSLVATLRALHAHKDPFSGGPAPLVSAELLAVAEELAPVVEPALRHDRDFDFDYFGLRTLQRSYLLGEADGARERPQHMLMRVALCVHGRDAPAVLQAYDLMSRGLFTHATPTMFNAGCPRQQLASCFLLTCKEDSIEASLALARTRTPAPPPTLGRQPQPQPQPQPGHLRLAATVRADLARGRGRRHLDVARPRGRLVHPLDGRQVLGPRAHAARQHGHACRPGSLLSA